MHYPQVKKRPTAKELEIEKAIYDDHRALAEAELRRIYADLHMTPDEIAVMKFHVADYVSGRTPAHQLRANLTHALENHRSHIIAQARFPQIERCAKCRVIHSNHDACPARIELIPPATAQAYRTLGLQPGASQEEIRSAYRKLAQQHHPDRANGDASKMRELNIAYQTLKGAK